MLDICKCDCCHSDRRLLLDTNMVAATQVDVYCWIQVRLLPLRSKSTLLYRIEATATLVDVYFWIQVSLLPLRSTSYAGYRGERLLPLRSTSYAGYRGERLLPLRSISSADTVEAAATTVNAYARYRC
jgi:hypothetical protein